MGTKSILLTRYVNKGDYMQKLIVFCAVGIVSLLSSCQRQYPKPTDRESVQKVRETMCPLVTEEKELNPYGSLLYAERMKDTYIENVGAVATYRFLARRFPPAGKYLLASENLGCPRQPYAWYDVDDDGQLGRQIDTGTLMLDNELILMFDYCKGESVDYWLVAQDGKARQCVTVVPYPIAVEARDGAQISVRRLTYDAGLVLLEGKDFNPDEQILVSSQSGTNRIDNVPITCINGKFSMLLEPSALGRSGGLAYVDVRRFKELLTLEYDWGSEATNAKKRLANTARIQPDALVRLPTDLNVIRK